MSTPSQRTAPLPNQAKVQVFGMFTHLLTVLFTCPAKTFDLVAGLPSVSRFTVNKEIFLKNDQSCMNSQRRRRCDAYETLWSRMECEDSWDRRILSISVSYDGTGVGPIIAHFPTLGFHHVEWDRSDLMLLTSEMWRNDVSRAKNQQRPRWGCEMISWIKKLVSRWLVI